MRRPTAGSLPSSRALKHEAHEAHEDHGEGLFSENLSFLSFSNFLRDLRALRGESSCSWQKLSPAYRTFRLNAPPSTRRAADRLSAAGRSETSAHPIDTDQRSRRADPARRMP